MNTGRKEEGKEEETRLNERARGDGDTVCVEFGLD